MEFDLEEGHVLHSRSVIGFPVGFFGEVDRDLVPVRKDPQDETVYRIHLFPGAYTFVNGADALTSELGLRGLRRRGRCLKNLRDDRSVKATRDDLRDLPGAKGGKGR